MDLEAGEAFEVGRSHIIKRPRLTQLLDETKARIILLVAPAGYGKTTLAREWLADKPHAWYRGSTASADVAALALGLARAAAKIVPGAESHLVKRLRVSDALVDVDPLAECIADHLARWPRDTWLAFDDYHFACDSEAAEQFVGSLVSAAAPLNLLITSRCAPRWATPRRVVYGELCELGQTHLGMNDDEVEQVLAHRPAQEARGINTVANGWPALIGLARLPQDIRLPPRGLPHELYRYFADELYQTLTPSMQRALRLLALTPTVTFETASSLIGREASGVIHEALRRGFFTSWSSDRWEFHPLLGRFLASKFRETNDDPDGQIVARLVHTQVEQRNWDLSFDLVERFFDASLLEILFESALVSMLDEARVPTLTRWVALAYEHSLQSPVIDLAEGEIALKQGDLCRAEAFALQSAHCSDADQSFRSKAFWLAGVSAHLLSRPTTALGHYELARALALTESDLRQALWGEFVATASLDQPDAAEALLLELEASSGSTADEALRVATGRLMLASLRGAVRSTLEQIARVAPLTARAGDPLIHSSFLNVHAAVLALGGRYRAALETASAELALASAYGLTFAVPDAHFERALALYGLRSFRNAATALNASERVAVQDGNQFLLMNIGILRARLQLPSDPNSALAVFERYQSTLERPAMQGEYFAWWSLGLALAGQSKQARSMAARAEGLSQRIEITGLTPWTRFVIAANNGVSLTKHGKVAFTTSLTSGNIDALVTAYRAFPQILTSLGADRDNQHHLREILLQANDQRLAESAGLRLPVSAEVQGPSILSNREREVLGFVTQGLTNKEIGRALFIEEVTVKAHMRSVCRKLAWEVAPRLRCAPLSSTTSGLRRAWLRSSAPSA
jgi:ATP/maltotriose-dependent transcriptional regulator MalT